MKTTGTAPKPSRAKLIGTATMLPDRTLVLDLYTSGSMHGQSRMTYAPDHPEYLEVLKHIGGLKPGEQKGVPPWPDDIDDARTEAAVHAYVAEKKGWSRSEYRVEITGTDRDKNIAVTVSHNDDRRGRAPGGGKSFALRIDPKTYGVVKELAFQ